MRVIESDASGTVGEGPILVIGAGAVGGVLGGLLARAGRRVAFLVHTEESARRIRAEGLEVSGIRGAFTVRAEASLWPDDLGGPFGVVLAAVKAYDLAPALRPALGLVASDGLVVSLQNGVTVDDLEAIVGPERAVGCVVGWGATLQPDGTAELTSEGSLVIGSRSPRVQARLEPLRRTLDAAFPTSISPDILADLYSKLIINSCITSLGALSGRTLGWMLSRRRYRNVFVGIIREAVAVADALGVRVPAYAGKLDYYRFLRGRGLLAGLRRHLLIRLMGVKYRRLKSSSLQSLERGRPTEVDWFNGWIGRKGRARGVLTPLNDRLTAMIHEIESGRRSIGPRNLEEPLPGLR
jgi:2-dehydropantoate 2-reductase